MTSPSTETPVRSSTPIASLPPIPPSPARSFASTAFPFPAASINLPAPPLPPTLPTILSRADVAASIIAYESLSNAAKEYRKALATMAAAASAFGSALETCARCKGVGDAADGLMNAGGLQYLIASNTHILSESLYRGFEVPLLHEVDSYKEKSAENDDRYKKEASEKSKNLRKREQEHLKLARQKKRNLSAFRSALVDLTHQIDDLEHLKYTHYRAALDHSQHTAARVLDLSALTVRAEIEIFEKVASKGWDSSGGLDDLIARSADPFAPAETGLDGQGEMFSILPSHSILPSPQGPIHSRPSSLTGSGGGTVQEGKYQSLTGVLSPNGDTEEDEDEDARSIFSGNFSNSSGQRGKLPPFSPSASSAGWGNMGQRRSSKDSDVGQLDLPPSVVGQDEGQNIYHEEERDEGWGGSET